MTFRLYVMQRVTAAILAPLIIGHIVMIFWATQQGLSAGAILARTRGSLGWGAFYGVFVLAAAVHGAIGIRAVAGEWGPAWLAGSRRRLDGLMWGLGAILAGLGLKAVYAVIAQ